MQPLDVAIRQPLRIFIEQHFVGFRPLTLQKSRAAQQIHAVLWHSTLDLSQFDPH